MYNGYTKDPDYSQYAHVDIDRESSCAERAKIRVAAAASSHKMPRGWAQACIAKHEADCAECGGEYTAELEADWHDTEASIRASWR